MERDFHFKFIKGRKQFESGKDALSFALQNSYLNVGDRGSLAVSLFDVHETDHYENAAELRRSTPADRLEILARSLVKEAEQNGWKNHIFCKRLKSRNRNLLSQLEEYGILIT